METNQVTPLEPKKEKMPLGIMAVLGVLAYSVCFLFLIASGSGGLTYLLIVPGIVLFVGILKRKPWAAFLGMIYFIAYACLGLLSMLLLHAFGGGGGYFQGYAFWGDLRVALDMGVSVLAAVCLPLNGNFFKK